MLWSALDWEPRQIMRTADDVSGRRASVCAQAQQSLKRGHWRSAPVVPEDELVKIDLQVVTADPMVGGDQPLLEISDRTIGEGHCRRRPLAEFAARGLRYNGGTGGFRSFSGFDPEREVGVVVLANSAHSVDDVGMHLLVPSFPLTPNRGGPSAAVLAGLALAVGILLFAMWRTSRD